MEEDKNTEINQSDYRIFVGFLFMKTSLSNVY